MSKILTFKMHATLKIADTMNGRTPTARREAYRLCEISQIGRDMTDLSFTLTLILSGKIQSGLRNVKKLTSNLSLKN